MQLALGLLRLVKKNLFTQQMYYQSAHVKHWKTHFQRGMLLLFKPYYFFRDSQRIPSRVFKSIEEALKKCCLLFALEGKAIIKVLPEML